MNHTGIFLLLFFALTFMLGDAHAQLEVKRNGFPEKETIQKDQKEEWLHYDSGVNHSAIGLNEAGIFHVGVRWLPSDLFEFDQYSITRIRFFIEDLPVSLEVKIWQGIDEDDLVLYESIVVVPESGSSWIEIELDEPYYIIPWQELWITYTVEDPGSGYFVAGIDDNDEQDGYYNGFANLVKLDEDQFWSTLEDHGIYGYWNLQVFLEIIWIPWPPMEATFNVDLSPVEPFFDPDTDQVYITGEMFGWAEPGELVAEQLMHRIDDSMIWSTTMELEYATEYQYKYFLNPGWWGGEWPGDPHRIAYCWQDMEFNDVWGLGPASSFPVVLDLYPAGSGTVEGDKNYLANANVNLHAIPVEGYRFLHWADPNDSVVSTLADYSFYMPLHVVHLTAHFELLTSTNQSSHKDIVIFPNPAKGTFRIISGSNIEHLRIMDVTGKVVYDVPANGPEATVEGFLQPGLYVLEIFTRGEMFIKKLIIHH